MNKVKEHSVVGYRILCSLSEFSEIAQYVYQHHERYDGTGYPVGIKGDNISFEARLLSIVDSYDAMTGIRTYRPALSKDDAILELRRCKGT
jgi:HD-GYP domain-containing protein (c-di-GMP phosphodiesterase class II)